MSNPSTPHVTAPHRSPSLVMGRVVLTVRDLQRVADFYQKVIGLQRQFADGETVLLGAGTTALIELRHDATAAVRSRREAGLFHTALLLPSRTALASWLKHATGARIPLLGASDHAVSEALYLSDPEGNGIEIYSDRPPSEWKWQDGLVDMPSNPLDLRSLLQQADDRIWEGIPPDTRIGHVHLQVGDIARAEQFYAGTLGLSITSHYPGGTFYAAPGYHHHIATNIWNSRGAGQRSSHTTGLAEVQIRLERSQIVAIRDRTSDTLVDGEGLVLKDPRCPERQQPLPPARTGRACMTKSPARSSSS